MQLHIKAKRVKAKRGQSGFTLIEIMVALFIVSFTIVAIIDVMAKHTNMTSELEKRVLASWVASNMVAELRHDAKINRVKQGKSSDTVEMGGMRWRARADIKETEVERVYLVTVQVQDDANRDAPPFAIMTTALTDRL